MTFRTAPLTLALSLALAACTPSGTTEVNAQEEPAADVVVADEVLEEVPVVVADAATDNDGKPRLGRLGKGLSGLKVPPRPSAGGSTPIVGPQVGPAPAGQAPQPVAPAKGLARFEEGGDVADFGDLVEGDLREHVFVLESAGEEPLRIDSVNKSCGCARAEVFVFGEGGEHLPYTIGQEIPVGAKFGIDASFNSTGKHHQTQAVITLTCNDPRRGVQLYLKANVQPALEANPPSLSFPTMAWDSTTRGKVVVTSEAYGAFHLRVDENVPAEGLELSLVPTEPDAEGRSTRWEVEVVAGPNLVEGAFNRAVRLVSDILQEGKATPSGEPVPYELTLFVMGNVVGPVAVDIPHLSFGLLRPGQVVTRECTIRVLEEGFTLAAPKVTVRGMAGDFEYADDLEVKLTPIEGTRDWKLEAVLLGIEPEGQAAVSFRGYFEIEIGHPAKPTLEVGFTGVVRAGVQ